MRYRLVMITLVTGGLFSALAATEYPDANPKPALTNIAWLKDTARRTDSVWRTRYDASKPERAYATRIIAYAGKWTRHNYGGHGGLGGSCGWRYASGPLVPKVAWSDIGHFLSDPVDVDGDGDTKDDFVYTIPHSMDVPLSIPDWPGANVFPERLSSTFYGGITFYCANNKATKAFDFSGEMGINADHSCFPDGRAEDHPINGMRHETIRGSFLRHYVTMIWKREDFLNTHGGRFRVSFDDNSRLATFCTRGYWYGWNDVRFIVQNGDQLYISEIVEPVPDYAFKDAGKLGKKPGYLPVCYPTRTRWAAYNPEGHKIDFDPNAEFTLVEFDDVRAAGWYLAKTDDSPVQTHCKWYGFEADAVVHTPAEPSANIEMVPVKGPGTPEFYIASCEVPYSLWQDINRYGDSPWNILEARYVYDKSGSMGSMAYGKREHKHDEPVTDLTFYDALALCNTLSEMEGKKPCYYLDPEFATVFRNQHIQSRLTYGDEEGYRVRNFQSPVAESLPLPKIHILWPADGHRLPTVAEWKAAAGSIGQPPPQTSGGTHAVGTTAANANGLYDMLGNVWELCWTFGDLYDPDVDAPVTALGGDFNHPAAPGTTTMSPFGDTPYSGAGNVGIRLVCRESESAKPDMGNPGGVPAWQFKRGEVFGRKEAPKVTRAVMNMVKIPGGAFVRSDKKTVTVDSFEMGAFVTTFDRWKTVRQWAEANGYDFDHNGDMGSMYFFDFAHSPDEPVTRISWFDMIAWCNALSEMEGRTPCYYSDEARTKIIRQAFDFNPIKLDGGDFIKVEKPLLMFYLQGPYATPWVFTRWDADGYRLPTGSEMDYAIRGGTETRYHWGDDDAEAGEYMWNAENSEGRTHPVGQKKPNPFGLYDIQGNVFELLYSRLRYGGDKNRPHSLDLDNPIHSPFYGWQLPVKEFAPRSARGLAGGPCFLFGGFNIKGQHGVGVESSPETEANHYYSDVGFRVVRCEAGTHPREGLRPLAEKQIVRYFEAKPEDYPVKGDPGFAIYRADLRRSGVFERSGVAGTPREKWKHQVGGILVSSPVVWRDMLFIGADNGIHCLDANTGEPKWVTPVKGGVDSSACVADGLALFATKDGRLVCITTGDGEIKWTLQGRTRSPVKSSPAVAYGTVFCALGLEIVAADLETGKKIWSIAENAPGEYASVALSQEALYACGLLNWGYLYSRNVETTEINWKSNGPYENGAGVYFAKTQALDAEDGIYINTTRGIRKYSSTIKGDAARGQHMRIWYTFLLDKQVDDNEMIMHTSPTPWNDKLFAGRKDGKFVALATEDGKELWRKQFSAECQSDPSVAATSGLVIFGCNDGNVYALDCATGEERWKFKTGAEVFSSPWIEDDVVYIATHDGLVYALVAE